MYRWKVAAYLRLSSEDGDKMESNSITNQKKLINMYIKKDKELNFKEFYIDDGYSGTDFERPDFKRMIKDIENGKINTIIVKDLSRFGRNYIEVGKYIEQFFPSYDIRFIAINDNIDSYKEPESINNVIVPFKNLMNDEYARDISNKVRSILNTKRKNGEFIGNSAPYGYLRDPKNVHKFIVDEEASVVVKKIFKMILDGNSKQKVVEDLNKLEIPTPRLYKVQKFDFKYKVTEEMQTWDTAKIDDILQNKTYIGYLEQGKKRRISHKVHKNIDISSEEWITIPNHHKALISEENFNTVQDIIYNRYLRVQKNKEYDLFAGHIKCADCGNTLTKRKGKIYDYYYCTSYIKNKTCSKHTCQIKKLKEIVLEMINKQIEIIFNLDKAIKQITKNTEVNYDVEILKNRLNDCNKAKIKYMKLKEELLDDLSNQLITENEYTEYKEDYNNNLSEIKKEIDKISLKLKSSKISKNSNKEWIYKFENRRQLNELNNKIIQELIDCIYVHEDGNITIKFKYKDEYEEAIKFVKENKEYIKP